MRVDMDSSDPQGWLLIEHVGGPVAYLLNLVYHPYHHHQGHLQTCPVEGWGKHNRHPTGVLESEGGKEVEHLRQLPTFWTWYTIPTIITRFTYGHVQWKDVEKHGS